MRQIKEYIYSLLLLMIMVISSSSVLLSTHCHCSADDPTLEHHECHHVDECRAHSSVIAHKCHGDSDSLLEYLAVAPQRVDNLQSVSLLFVVCSLLSLESVDTHAVLNVVESEALYECYDPSSGALRAPPVLV